MTANIRAGNHLADPCGKIGALAVHVERPSCVGSPWLNIERFFRDISENRLRRGMFTSAYELIAANGGSIAHRYTPVQAFDL